MLHKKKEFVFFEVTTNPSRYGNDVGRGGFCLLLQSNHIFNSLQKYHICKCAPSRLEFGSPPPAKISSHCPHPCRIHKITITLGNIYFFYFFYLGEGLETDKRWILATPPTPPTLNIGKNPTPHLYPIKARFSEKIRTNFGDL